jgi:phosphoglycolate phosphatase-like HAD superfamily hydrolase
MNMGFRLRIVAAASLLCAAAVPVLMTGCATARDSRAAARSSSARLDSWREGATRTAIESFVARTTDPSSPDFVPEAERIAVFDNDGALWAEQPMYVQLAFTIDRVKALRAAHPEWETTEPFASLLKGDAKAVAAQGEHALGALVAATHGGMTDEEFRATVRAWLATTRHPTMGLRYDEMVYRPMVEMLAYLRAHGYRTFIVSGGGVDFVRAYASEAYGIPSDQVIGSTAKYRYEVRDGVAHFSPSMSPENAPLGKPSGSPRNARRPFPASIVWLQVAAIRASVSAGMLEMGCGFVRSSSHEASTSTPEGLRWPPSFPP